MGAVATLDMPAAAVMVFSIATRQAGAGTGFPNTVGSIQFAAGATTRSFWAGLNPTMAIGAGGLLTVLAPSTVDANAAGLEIAIPYSLE